MTNKLILDANGKKFGKSEGNAIWLDENKTSPYEVYQYFMNTLDEDIEKYLKLLSFLSEEEISEIVDEHTKSPEKRYGQKTLAKIIVEMVHGMKQAELAEKISEFLFGESEKLELLKGLSEEELNVFSESIGGVDYTLQNLFELFVQSGLESSNSTARQTLQSGGMFVNEVQITDGKYDFSQDWINGKFLLLRKGKKSYRLILKR